MGPLAVDGSTTLPPWVMSTRPWAISRLAARRAGSIRSVHPSSPATARAASEGQIVAPAPRWSSSPMIAASNAASVAVTLRVRHAALHHRTPPRAPPGPRRAGIARPHEAQVALSDGRSSIVGPYRRPPHYRQPLPIARPGAAGGDATIVAMGFNPHRQYKRRPSDYVLVAVSLALVLALVAWGFLG